MDYNKKQADPEVTGMEYLEQISAKPPSKFSFINRKVLIAAAAFLIVLISLIIVSAVVGNRNAGNAETLSAQFASLSTLVDYGKKNDIGDSAVSKVVAETSLTLSSAKSQLGKFVTLPKPSNELVASEAVDDTVTDLNIAKSTGNLSTEYPAALKRKINEIIVSLTNLRSGMNADGRQTVDQLLANFTELNSRL